MDNRRPELTKRKKELARQQKQKQKLERREQRQREKLDRGEGEVEDPDIAGIIPGPQPVAEE
ncbi:MAG TPA: hypothetical protein VFH73_01715 [Polyangia bacterium]|nr:hypothetical protein [Polyangia bacterium]